MHVRYGGKKPPMSKATPDKTSDFSTRLFSRMRAKSWNQSDLARAAGLGRDSISTYVRGMVFPDAKNIKRLADALGCTPSDLVPDIPKLDEPVSDNAVFEIRQTGDGKVFVKINQFVTIDQAAAIFAALREK